MTLFRPEALAAQSRTEGVLQIRRSGAQALVVGTLALIGAGVLAFLILGTYGSRAAASGQLQPSRGLISVQPAVAGTLESLEAREGEHVARGATLAVVAVDAVAGDGPTLGDAVERSLEDRRRATEAGVSAQLAQLEQQEVTLTAQVDATRTERARLADQIQTTAQRRSLAARQRGRLAELRAKGYLSELQVQQAETEELQLLAAYQALQREDAALARAQTQVEQQLQELPIKRQALAAQRQGDLALLSQQDAEASTRRARRLDAPTAGVVTARLAEPGQPVQPGQALLTLLPDGAELEAHLLVSSRAIGFIEPGDPVRLRYQAFPHEKFGHQAGTVSRVSRSPVGNDAAGNPQYRIVVALAHQYVTAYGQREALLPGMQVEADIVLEQRRLIEWVFEPLYALQGRL